MNPSPDSLRAAGATPNAEGRRHGLAVLAGGLAAAAGAGLAFRLELSPGASNVVARGAPPARIGRIPDVPLITHEGKPVRFYSDLVKGRTVLLSMMYTQCSERCPPMTQNLRAVQEALNALAL